MAKFKLFRNKRVILGIIVVLVLGLIIRTLLTPKPKNLNSSQIKRGEVKEELTLSGTIEANEHVNLQFQTGGLLSWVGVKEGDKVNKYQAIASLDNRSLKQTLDKRLNDYMKYRFSYDQISKDDYKDKVITDTIKRLIDKAGFDLSNSMIDVELQQIAINLATLTTPISGIVIRVDYPYPGINIPTGVSPFEIINPDTLYFSVTADQTEVTKLKENDNATISLDAYSENQIGGVIKSIAYSPKQGETGTVYEVKIDFMDKNNLSKLRLGMTGDCIFTISKKDNVLYVPPQYIKNDVKGKYILTNQNKKVYISTGIEGSDRIEISGSVSEGEVIYD